MSRLTHAFWMTHGRIKRLAAWPFCPDDAHGRPHTIGVPRPTDSATSLALKCPRRPKNAPQPAHLLLSGRAGPEKLPQLHVLISRSRHSPWTSPRSPPSPPQLPAEACVCAVHGRVLRKPAQIKREVAGARQRQAGSGRLADSHALSLYRRLSYTVACAAQAHEQRGSSAHFSRGAVQRDHAAQC